MQFQVPQFIDTEDKIVGPLSLRQFAYVAVAALVSGIFYFFAQPWLWIIVSLIVFGFAIALAFVKIEGRPFVNVLVAAFHFYWKPQTYVWQPEHPKVAAPKEMTKSTENGASLEKILAEAMPKKRPVAPTHPMAQIRHSPFTPVSKPASESRPQLQQPQKLQPQPMTRESVSAGATLHKLWENVQTGSSLTKKQSDKQYLEQKMAERYQIFKRISGDRNAARRVDYR